MSDESKADRVKAAIFFLTCVAIVTTVHWWGPIVDEALRPKPIVVMHCKGE